MRASSARGRRVTLHPAIPTYLNTLFPSSKWRNLGGGAAGICFRQRSPRTSTSFGASRSPLFHQDSVFVRYTLDSGKVNRTPPTKPPITYTQEKSRNQYATIEHQHTFSPRLLNEIRFGINRSTSLADNVRTIDIPSSLSWIPGEQFGYFTISGLVTEAAGDYRLPRLDRLNNISLSDNVLIRRGRRAQLRFQGQRIHFNQNTTSQRGGIVTFTNLENFLTGVAQNVDFAVPGQIDPVRGYRQWLFGFFGQDDVQLSRNLMLNAGLRYEFVTVPTSERKISNLRNVNETQITISPPWHSNPSLKFRAATRPGVGSVWLRQDFCACRLRLVLR